MGGTNFFLDFSGRGVTIFGVKRERVNKKSWTEQLLYCSLVTESNLSCIFFHVSSIKNSKMAGIAKHCKIGTSQWSKIERKHIKLSLLFICIIACYEMQTAVVMYFFLYSPAG